MAARYVHVEVTTSQSSKKSGEPCGDVFACRRDPAATVLACVDGIGSGIRARIAAEMCLSRLIELVELGFSLHRAVDRVAGTMREIREPGRPYAAFTIARIRTDGMATVLSYEAPPAILISHRHAAPLPARAEHMGGTLVNESHCHLVPGEGLLLMSDGITQAGLGSGLPSGWQTEGVARFVNDRLAEGIKLDVLPDLIRREAQRLWRRGGDDCTVLLASCQPGQVVNILTGPPANRANDARAVEQFLLADGLKIVCGGTTAEVVARQLRVPLRVEQNPTSMIAPPRYEIPGVDLVTEGAVTLNQVYNIFDEDVHKLTEDSGVTELCALLHVADRVNLFVGAARNGASGDISFRQRGILTRERIVPLLAEKLESAGKLVVLQPV